MGRPAGISPVVGTPSAGSPSYGGSNDRQRDNPERDRFSRQQPFAKHDQPDRDDPDDENDVVHLTELPGQQPNPFKKVMTTACHAEKTWQLSHGDGQAGASLEAHKNTVADQLHERAQSQQPSEQAKSLRP